jgi:glutaminyl-tRNA synthetase
MTLLESCIRDDLNPVAPRVLAVLRPLKLVIDNYPADKVEWFDAPYYPHDVPREGTRPLPFSRELVIEQTDFMENPPRDFYRMAPGRDVRLRHAYIVTCTGVVKDDTGQVVEVHCTYDPATRSGEPGAEKRKVQTAIQWVSAAHALPAEVRMYDRLLRVPDPDAEGVDFKLALNPDSLEVIPKAWVEPSIANDPADTRYQFERSGYFWQDPVDSRPTALVFNRIVGLRDSWSRANAKPVATRVVEKTAKAAASEPSGDGKPRIPGRSDELMAAWQRYVREFGLTDEEAELLTREGELAAWYEASVAAYPANPKSVATWVNHDLQPELRERSLSELALTPAALAALVRLVDEGTISTAAARTVFAELVENGGDPAEIVVTRGLAQVSDRSTLLPVVEAVINSNPDKAAQYRSGKTGLLGFFTGMVMKETRGSANPALVQELLLEVLADNS